MTPAPADLPLNEYRLQVARLLVQADKCKIDKAGIGAALKLRRRARNLQAIITKHGS